MEIFLNARSDLMYVPISLLAESDTLYVLRQATIEGKVIIGVLIAFSIFAWSVMAGKALQMRRAKKLNQYFEAEFRIFQEQPQVRGAAGGFGIFRKGLFEQRKQRCETGRCGHDFLSVHFRHSR